MYCAYTYAGIYLQEPVPALQPSRRWPVACGNTTGAPIPQGLQKPRDRGHNVSTELCFILINTVQARRLRL